MSLTFDMEYSIIAKTISVQGYSMATTIRQIAQKANVSLTTVSRVLNGTAGQIRICPETERHILDIAKELNYTPNFLAKGLRSGKSNLIGVILGDVNKSSHARLLQGIDSYLASNKYGVVVRTKGSPGENELDSIHFLLDRKVDGMIVNSEIYRFMYNCKESRASIEKLHNENIPVILVGQNSKFELDTPFLGHDDRLVGHMATRYLIGLGHKSILCITNSGNGNPVGVLRMQGYKNALAEAGIELEQKLILNINPSSSTYSTVGYESMREYLKGGVRFSAIFSHCDAASVGIFKAIKEFRYTIPRDFSIISVDNDEYANYIDPPLTSIWLDDYELGRGLAENILLLIDGKNTNCAPLEPKLIERHSCGLATKQ